MAAEFTPGGIDSVCHPSKVDEMSTSVLVIRALHQRQPAATRLNTRVRVRACVRVSHFVKVSNTRNVVLSRFPKHSARVINHHGSVPQCVTMPTIALQDGRYNHHVVVRCYLQEIVAAPDIK